MAVARKIAYNVVFVTFSKIFSVLLALVGIGLITRYLGQEGFGNYATAIAFFTLFGSLADLGIYSVATREISRPGANEAKIMGNAFTLRLSVSTLIFLLVPVLIFFLPYPEEVKFAILIAAGAFVFSSTYSVLNGLFQKNLAMNKVALAELTGKVVQLLVIFLAVKNNLGFIFVVCSLLAAMITNFILVYLWSRRFLVFRFDFDFSYWKKFLKESWPMGVAVIVSFVYFKADTILLSLLKGGAEAGIYNVAYKVIENVIFFPGMVMGLILPLTSYNIIANQSRFEAISNKVFKFFLILALPLALGSFFLAEKITTLIGGAGFEESSLVLKILAFSMFFIFFGNFSNTILLSCGLQKKLMQALSFCALFSVTLNLVLIPRFSYFGSAAISVATEVLVVATTFYLIIKHVKYRPSLEKGLGIFFSAAIMILFLLLFYKFNLFWLVLGGGAIYSIMLWLTGSISLSEIKSVLKKPLETDGKNF